MLAHLLMIYVMCKQVFPNIRVYTEQAEGKDMVLAKLSEPRLHLHQDANQRKRFIENYGRNYHFTALA